MWGWEMGRVNGTGIRLKRRSPCIFHTYGVQMFVATSCSSEKYFWFGPGYWNGGGDWNWVWFKAPPYLIYKDVGSWVENTPPYGQNYGYV